MKTCYCKMVVEEVWEHVARKQGMSSSSQFVYSFLNTLLTMISECFYTGTFLSPAMNF